MGGGPFMCVCLQCPAGHNRARTSVGTLAGWHRWVMLGLLCAVIGSVTPAGVLDRVGGAPSLTGIMAGYNTTLRRLICVSSVPRAKHTPSDPP